MLHKTFKNSLNVALNLLNILFPNFLELEMIDVSFLMSCFIDNSMYIYLDKYDYYNEKMKVRAYSQSESESENVLSQFVSLLETYIAHLDEDMPPST